LPKFAEIRKTIQNRSNQKKLPKITQLSAQFLINKPFVDCPLTGDIDGLLQAVRASNQAQLHTPPIH
jgi:hypothetical protein